MTSIGTPALWAGFSVFILAMLALDLGVFHRKAHLPSMREAAAWTVVWILLSALFAAVVWWRAGSEKSLEFATGYVLEKALSIDNMFVFVVIFGYFAVPKELHHHVLFWGIFGALAMRLLFILAGAALLRRWDWILYLFGAILVVTGVKLFRQKNEDIRPEDNPILRLARRLIPASQGYHGSRFTVMQEGRRVATPLLFVLVAVEATDVVFAVDSIPAVFGVTKDPFIVYTSNVFAILGLRALYFLVAGMMGRFHYLKAGLSFVLVFIGLKMLLSWKYHPPIWASLAVVGGLITLSVLASLLRPAKGS